MSTQLKEFKVSNDAFDDAEELRRRIDEDGYLFFKKLQDPDKLWKLRLEMLEAIRAGGWIVDGTELADGRVDVSKRCTEGDLEYRDVYKGVYRLESFHQAGHWPEVIGMIGKIVDDEVFSHPMKIARLWFPQFTEHTTPAHQDFVHFQGSYETYTCWAPVSDCPIELGGLALLPGSHKKKMVFDHHFSLGAGGLSVDSDEMAGEWFTTDYEIGDSLIFPSLTVHRALPNLTEDRLRISLDNRYAALGSPIAEHMLCPHYDIANDGEWEEVYRDWKSNELKYYWKDLDFPVTDKIETWGEKAFEEALTLAREGDERAILRLNRMIKFDPDSDQAKTAKEALAEFEHKTGGVAA